MLHATSAEAGLLLAAQLVEDNPTNMTLAVYVLESAGLALLFGFIGLMVAVPLLAVVIVPIKLLYMEGVVGEVDEGVPGITSNAALPLAQAPAAGSAKEG